MLFNDKQWADTRLPDLWVCNVLLLQVKSVILHLPPQLRNYPLSSYLVVTLSLPFLQYNRLWLALSLLPFHFATCTESVVDEGPSKHAKLSLSPELYFFFWEALLSTSRRSPSTRKQSYAFHYAASLDLPEGRPLEPQWLNVTSYHVSKACRNRFGQVWIAKQSIRPTKALGCPL